ncbi:hypothetical protein PBRA_000407, partial [Plasmodiophora brassicae]
LLYASVTRRVRLAATHPYLVVPGQCLQRSTQPKHPTYNKQSAGIYGSNSSGTTVRCTTTETRPYRAEVFHRSPFFWSCAAPMSGHLLCFVGARAADPRQFEPVQIMSQHQFVSINPVPCIRRVRIRVELDPAPGTQCRPVWQGRSRRPTSVESLTLGYAVTTTSECRAGSNPRGCLDCLMTGDGMGRDPDYAHTRRPRHDRWQR